MKSLLSIVLILSVLLCQSQDYESVFIKNEDLLSKLDQKDLVVIHVEQPSGYNNGHVPGAVFMSSNDFTIRKGNVVFEIPEAQDFAAALASRGVDSNTDIVISPGWDSFEYAYRLYYTLDYYGLGEKARILDGGIRQWKADGFKISKDTVVAEETDPLKLTGSPDKLATKDWIVENFGNDKVKVLDARVDAFYTGKSGSYERGGHIKGSGRVTWIDLVDENHNLVSEQEIRNMFQDAGASDAEVITTYCHIGLRASVLYTVAKSLGYDTRLYDGSMNEWSTLSDDYPVERGKK